MPKWSVLNAYRHFHPIVYCLIVGVVLARIASSMSMPFLAIYLGMRTDMSPVTIGLVIGVGSIATTVGGFFGGNLSDRFGRSVIMFGALFTWSAVFMAFSVAEHPLVFMLLNMLNGLCRSFFEPVSQALMADLTPPDRRMKVFSLRYFAANVGVAVGPLLGAYLGVKEGAAPFLITGIIYLIYATALFVLLNSFGIKKVESGKSKQRATMLEAFRVLGKDGALRFFILGGIIVSIGYSQMTVTLSQHLERTYVDGIERFAVLMSANALTVIALQLFISRWFENRSPVWGIYMGNVAFAIGFVGFALSESWWAWILSMVVFTIGEILNYPAGTMLMDRLAPEHLRGTYFGAQSFQSLGHFIGPWAGGLLLSGYGGSVMFTVMGFVAMAGSIFYAFGDRIFRARSQHLRQEKIGMEQ